MTPGRHLRVLVTAFSTLLAAAPFSGAAGQLARELGLIPASGPAGPAGPGATSSIALLPTHTSFALEQLRHERVREARLATRHTIKQLFHDAGVSYPAAELFMRIFKREQTLELWVRSREARTFTLLKSYRICALAGELGPKRRQGDMQVPEGFYTIGWFNPRSEYHLSLHLDYPNRRDRAAGLQGVSLGGDIYIHGGCQSEGCLAVTDDGIRELYWLSVEARAGGQHRIPVHIFPSRMNDAEFALLRRTYGTRPDLNHFWSTLKPGYDFFEQHRRLPAMGLNARGEYELLGALADLPLGDPLRDGPPLRRIAPADGPRGRQPLGTPLGTPAGTPGSSPVGG